MFKVSTGLIMTIIVGLVCLIGFSDIPALATDASVTVNAMLDHVTVTPVNPSVPTTTSAYTFTVTAIYSNAPDADVTYSANWSSSNTSVATIGLHTGLATIITEGTTTVTAEYEGKSANTTLVVTAGTSPPSGGGGGGGGGGSGVSGSTTILTDINSEGLILVDTIAASNDGQTTLYLPEGTTAKNKYDQPLRTITIKESTELPEPPADCQLICIAYDIGPNGATFDPPVFLIYNYSDSQIPAGVAEENVVFATCQDGQWVRLEGGIVDTINNVVTVPISHLSLFTVVAYTSPARFEVSNLAVSPVDVHPYETITVRATITNTGDLTGSFEAILIVDSEVVRNQTKTLKGGSSETIAFDIIADTVGEHQVSLGNMVAIFVVKKSPTAATFTVSELKINPTSINSGEKVDISVYIENTGDLAGTYPIVLYVDDETMETREVALDGGGRMTLSFSFSADTIGKHTVKIGDFQGVFEVTSSSLPTIPELSSLELNGFSTTPDYDEITNTLVSVKIEYQMNETWTSETDSMLIMTVLHNGELLERIPLLTLEQPINNGKNGELNYIPSAGWIAGEYTFQVELYDGEDILQETLSHSLVVTPEAVTKVVSLWTLGTVIGIITILIIVMMTVIVYRRRDMLRNKPKIIRYVKYY